MSKENGKVVALRRTYRGEEAWFGLLEELGHSGLRRAFIGAGVSPRVAGNLVFFLEEQVTLDRHLSERSRVQYRDELERLNPDDVRKVAHSLAIGGLFNGRRSAA